MKLYRFDPHNYGNGVAVVAATEEIARQCVKQHYQKEIEKAPTPEMAQWYEEQIRHLDDGHWKVITHEIGDVFQYNWA